MSLYPIQPSFAAGELSPSLWGRVDLAKYQVGLKTCENFLIHPHGGVSRRPGMRYITGAKGKCRLVSFSYNAEQSYILEFGAGYIRFFKDGAPIMNGSNPYEISTPYTEAQLEGLNFTQSADVLFVVHPKHQPRELARYADTHWTLTAFHFKNGPFMVQTEGQSNISLSAGAIRGNTTLTASAALFTSAMVGSLFEIHQHVDEVCEKETREFNSSSEQIDRYECDVTYCYKVRSSYYVDNGGDNGGGYWDTDYTYYFALTAAQRANVSVGDEIIYNNKTASVTGIYAITSSFLGPGADSNLFAVSVSGSMSPRAGRISIAHKTSTNLPWGKSVTCYSSWRLETNGFWCGTFYLERFDKTEGRWIKVKTYTSPSSDKAAKNYTDSGEFDEPTQLRITSTDFATFVPTDNQQTDRGYIVLAANEGNHVGHVRITSVSSPTVANVQVETDLVSTTPTTLWRMGAWSNAQGWPSSVGFYQERIVFGGTPKEPQTIWFSKTGDYYDFGISHPIVDDDAISATLAARQVNPIRHFVGLESLLVLTGGSEWVVSGEKAITPTALNARPQGYRGCDLLEPIVIGNMILFVQAQGYRVRDLGYSFESDNYTGNDLTVMASHMLNGHVIKDWAYQQEPNSMVWLARDDGALISLTYLREHDVIAWSRHPTDGFVESVATIDGDQGTDVYFVVRRGNVRCIEVMSPMEVTTPQEAFFLDSAITVRNAAGTKTITGLGRFNGKTITTLADGSYVGEFTVANGTITLPYNAKVVHVGLNYESVLKTLDISTQRQDGTSMTRKARVVSVAVKIEKTRGLFVGVDEDHLEEAIDRTDTPYGDPTRLQEGDIHLSLDSSYASKNSGSLIIKTKFPLPASVLGIVPEVSFGG